MSFFYSAYGMQISSEIFLPELSVSNRADDQADLEILYGSVTTDALENPKQIGPFIWADTNDLLFEVPGVARFLISSGKQILIDPASGIDAESVRVFLLGSAFGAALLQRRLLVLHGNGIEINGKCLICVGPSGIGKSTLTAAFLQRGHRILADDVIPIEPSGMAIPGFPRIKLWQDVAEKMGIDTTQLSRIRPELQKFNLPLKENFCEIPTPVIRICVLSEHQSNSVEVTPITGIEKFRILQANTYRSRFMAGMSLQNSHLSQCSTLAQNISMIKVSRPMEGFQINLLADAIFNDIHEGQ